MSDFVLPWFAAYTRPHHERVTAGSLEKRGYEILFPRYRVASRWKDRVKQIELPLFPGYVLVRCDPHKRLPVLQTPGLLHLVSDGDGPLPVPEAEVENLRRACIHHARMEPVPFTKIGERVRVRWGPLEGLEGILTAKRGCLRVVISVELLARSVAVEIDGACLEKV